VVLFLVAAAALAQPAAAEDELLTRTILAGESARTARRVAAADKLVAEQKWAEAVEEYQRILTEDGDDLVRLDARHCLQARRLCHLRLAVLEPAGLRLYRSRVDSRAKKWLDQGTATRDTDLLRRLVDETFCSTYTDQALDLLGDLAFERGAFDEAERWWRMLAMPASQKDKPRATKDALVFPDPQVDEARVRAKQILARLFQGDRAGLEEDWQAFQALHSKASGPLAGRTGNYAVILRELAGQPAAVVMPALPEAWPTVGGNASRNHILPRAVGRLARLPQLDGPLWSVSLEVKDRGQEGDNEAPGGRAIAAARAARSLAFNPIIVGDRVFVSDARYVTAYKLSSGRQVVQYDLAPEGRNGDLAVSLKLPAEPDLSYTLTADEDRLYARLGAQAVGPRRGGDHETYLVCLNLHGTLQRWTARPPAAEAGPAVFEGAPVVSQGRVYIAVTRLTAVQTQTAVCCYSADTGALRWQREVCETQELKDGERRPRHHLLTLAGPNIAYCSHSGAIVALDAATGGRVWAVRYPSRGLKTADGWPSPRGLAPCLYASGRVYAAPLDYDRILCLDADTGHLVWESTPVEVIHLLGVARGRLIFTMATPQRGIRAVEASTGNPQGGWVQPADGSGLPTFGRGLLAGDWVFWPTRDGLHVLNLEDGAPVMFDPKIRGNLAAANGCLVVADAMQLSAYVPEDQLLERRQREAAAPGATALNRYRLALAEAAAGLETRALADLVRVESEAGAARWHGTALRDLARRQRYEVLLEAAERAIGLKHWERATSFFDRAAAPEFPVSARLQALARQASAWTRAGQPARAVAVWQTILEDASFGQGQLLDAQEVPQSVSLYACARMSELIRTHGPEVYEAFEQRAQALWDSVAATKRKEVLSRLGRDFPNATVTGQALLRLARASEETEQAGAAAQAYRLFLRRGAADPERPVALAGLAQAYERQNCWLAARAIWQQLGAEQDDRIVAVLNPDHPVKDFVTRQLQKPQYQARPPPATPPLPLTRTWQSTEDDLENGAPEPVLAAPGTDLLLSVRLLTVTCRDAATGHPYWEHALRATPTWFGCFGDTVLVAGNADIQCFRRADGDLVWSWSVPASSWSSSKETGIGPLAGFRLAGSRLFFLQGGQRLFALDASTGLGLWSAWAPEARLGLPYPAGRFTPQFYAGEEGLVLQTTGGHYLALDARTGRKRGEGSTVKETWSQPPLAQDERRVYVVNSLERVALLDSATGAEVWVHPIERPVSLTGEPLQILGNHETLLVLVPRNYGYLLESLDGQTGRRCWPGDRFLGVRPVRLSLGALDETTAYLVQDDAVSAYALEDGRRLWRHSLPALAGTWHTALTPKQLFVFPGEVHTEQVEIHWPGIAAQAWLELPCRTERGYYFPVLISDPKTGELVQQLNLPATAPRLGFRFLPDLVPVTIPRVDCQQFWSKGAAPLLQILGRGVAVVCDGKAWTFLGASDH
jgi:outer membrane protein assembly factor BamB